MNQPETQSQYIIRAFRKEESPADFEKARLIRMEVFVEEQLVPVEEEQDDYDDEAIHWLFLHAETLEPIATGRVLSYQEGCQMRPVAKIGRIAVRKHDRGKNVGRKLMSEILKTVRAGGYDQAILDSQTSVVKFYQSFGFETEGDEFLDAHIPHYRMRLVL